MLCAVVLPPQVTSIAVGIPFSFLFYSAHQVLFTILKCLINKMWKFWAQLATWVLMRGGWSFMVWMPWVLFHATTSRACMFLSPHHRRCCELKIGLWPKKDWKAWWGSAVEQNQSENVWGFFNVYAIQMLNLRNRKKIRELFQITTKAVRLNYC